MTESETLESKIAKLPIGYVTCRTVKGRTYYSHQGTTDGRQFSRAISEEEANSLKPLIERRKQLEKELKKLRFRAKKSSVLPALKSGLSTSVTFGKPLADFAEPSRNLKKRDCFSTVEEYVNGKTADKVCIVYGLRRTGKTTLLKQLALSLSDEQKSKTAYIKCGTKDTVASLNADIAKLRDGGFKYLLIDEATLMTDFIDSASLFSDVYAAQGIKIVLSGTDSLGFRFAANDELYDRAVMVHTTFIPYREHSRLLGINDIDDYIRYGGTLKAGELDFESSEVNAKDASFRSDESTRRYIDTAICTNIQHSLECFKDGKYFRHLRTLYEADELTNAINRIIESLNHDFTARIITRTFRSRDLGSAAQELRNEKNPDKRTEILDTIDPKPILATLKKILSIKEKEEQTIGVTAAHIEEIKEYLKSLDLIEKISVESRFSDRPELNVSENYYIFTQPGMRYCQAEALIFSLMKDPQIGELDATVRKLIADKISEDVMGNMMEDIIILETKKSLQKEWRNRKDVFKLRFSDGEFDMVISDPETVSCEIYEIKHSSQAVPSQYRHLTNPGYLALTEKTFGRITKKAVIYKGKPHTESNAVEYINAEDYLSGLK